MIKPSFVFTDNAVLQRDKEIRIFGECDSKNLTVSFAGNSSSAKIENGKFIATLSPMPAGVRGELVFESDDEKVVYKNVVTGDIWIAGGQSNMEHMTFCSLYGDEDIAADPDIRIFDVPRRPYEDAKIWGWHFRAVFSEDTPWVEYSPDSALRFSAVASFFAKGLKRGTDVPIGILGCNWGATNAETWTKREKLLEKPMARFAVDSYDKRFADLDKEAYHERFGIFQKKLLEYMDEHGEAVDTAARLGAEYALKHNFSITIEEGPYHYKHPGNLRMTMLERIVPLSVKGVIWYQGESNCMDGLPYPIDEWFTEVMHTMIDDWREAFCDPKLPFYLVQLSTYPRVKAFDNGWRFIRDVHEKLGEEENIYTVVAADIGEFDNIHPIDKKPVGERLALAALANEYGKDVKWQSPKFASFSQKDGKYIFAFYNAELLTYKGDKPEGFFITLKSGEIIPCDAEIKGNTIEVKENPDASAIGYCDINYCIANICNEAGLPLFPFHKEL